MECVLELELVEEGGGEAFMLTAWGVGKEGKEEDCCGWTWATREGNRRGSIRYSDSVFEQRFVLGNDKCLLTVTY